MPLQQFQVLAEPPDIGFEPDLLRGVFLELAGPVGHERSSAVINIRSQHAPRVLRR
jgi:hypothetical protein